MAVATSIPAVTIWQPSATLLARGLKAYETRSWWPRRKIIGRRIAIHAGTHETTTDEVSDGLASIICHEGLDLLDMPYGAVTATALLMAVHKTDDRRPLVSAVTDTDRLIADCRDWEMHLRSRAQEAELAKYDPLFDSPAVLLRVRADMLDRFAAELSRLQAKVAELQRDKARLDWVEGTIPHGGVSLCSNVYGRMPDAIILHSWDCETRSVDDEPVPHYGTSARAAIDSAMAEEGDQ